jgi:hypothetical protein
MLRQAPSRGAIARGLGRSYGDAAQNGGGHVLLSERLDAVIDLDAEHGRITVEAGASLDSCIRMLEPRTREAAAREIARVVRPDGILLWYDFVLNPTNRDTHGIRAVELRRLFPGFSVDAHRLTLAPPMARFIAPRSSRLAAMLQEIRPLQTHLLAFLRPPNG